MVKYLDSIVRKLPILENIFSDRQKPLERFMMKLKTIQTKKKGEDIDLSFKDHIKCQDNEERSVYVEFLLVSSRHSASAYVSHVKKPPTRNADILYIFSKGSSNNKIAREVGKKIVKLNLFSNITEYPSSSSNNDQDKNASEKCFSLKKSHQVR